MSARVALRALSFLTSVLPALKNGGKVALQRRVALNGLLNQRTLHPPTCDGVKFYCQSTNEIQIATYDEIKALPRHPEKFLIDVREPSELSNTGTIPGSINIPLADVKDALCLNDKAFEKKYGAKKPQPNTEIIFTCRSGVRAGKAAVAATSLGFLNVKNYKGSWTEWAEKEGLPK